MIICWGLLIIVDTKANSLSSEQQFNNAAQILLHVTASTYGRPVQCQLAYPDVTEAKLPFSSNDDISLHCIHMPDGQASCEQSKNQERLCPCLVFDVVLDWIWDEVLNLKENLWQYECKEDGSI